jgi:lysozyme
MNFVRLGLLSAGVGCCSGSCLHFEPGLLCPGNCMCTMGDACAAPRSSDSKGGFLPTKQRGVRGFSSTKGNDAKPGAATSCPGECRKVANSSSSTSTSRSSSSSSRSSSTTTNNNNNNECLGDDASCLADQGPCDERHHQQQQQQPDGPGGPDVSHYQGEIDWAEVKASGASFVFMKATEGHTFVDPTFAANWAGSRAAGIAVRGAYHFGHPGSDATTQAEFFVNTVGTVGPGDVVVLDIEESDSVSPGEVAAWCTAFLEQVTALTALPESRVVVYTGAWFWDPQAGGASMGEHPLWVSGYTTEPPMPKGWDKWTFWQFTDKLPVPGVPGSGTSDYSVFAGDEAALEVFAGL